MLGSYFLGDRAFALREQETRPLGERDLRLKVAAAGVCGTDVHIFRGEKGSAEVAPPVVLGHEFSGVVTQVGPGVQKFRVGDHVAVDPNIYCGTCLYCRRGQRQHCECLTAIGVNRDGGFAESCVVPESQAFLLRPDLPLEEGALMEPLSCCIHGIRRAEIQFGDTVCVIGGGAIGQLMVQLALLSGAGRVLLSEPVAARRDLALQNGACAAFDPTESPLEEQVAAAGLAPVDVVVECVGNTEATAQAFKVAGRGARVLLFSVPHPDATAPLPLFQVFQRELKVLGSFINPDACEQAAALLNAGKLRVSPLITHRYPLAKVREAIEKQTQPDSIKVMVLPNG